MPQPLVEVVRRGLPEGRGYGWMDELACGHSVPFDGNRVQARRCPDCPPVEDVVADPGQLRLL